MISATEGKAHYPAISHCQLAGLGWMASREVIDAGAVEASVLAASRGRCDSREEHGALGAMSRARRMAPCGPRPRGWPRPS